MCSSLDIASDTNRFVWDLPGAPCPIAKCVMWLFGWSWATCSRYDMFDLNFINPDDFDDYEHYVYTQFDHSSKRSIQVFPPGEFRKDCYEDERKLLPCEVKCVLRRENSRIRDKARRLEYIRQKRYLVHAFNNSYSDSESEKTETHVPYPPGFFTFETNVREVEYTSGDGHGSNLFFNDRDVHGQ